MVHIAVADARKELADMINRVAYCGERFILDRRGRPAAALVSAEDLALLEDMEDRQDTVEARRRIRAEAQKAVPYGSARQGLGLE